MKKIREGCDCELAGRCRIFWFFGPAKVRCATGEMESSWLQISLGLWFLTLSVELGHDMIESIMRPEELRTLLRRQPFVPIRDRSEKLFAIVCEGLDWERAIPDVRRYSDANYEQPLYGQANVLHELV